MTPRTGNILIIGAIGALFAFMIGLDHQSAQAQQNPISLLQSFSQLQFFQLPKVARGTTCVYFVSAPVTGPIQYGCAAVGSGVTIDSSTMPPTIKAATAPMVVTFGEVPAGTIDGVNRLFTLSKTPVIPTSLQLWRGPTIQQPNGIDYTFAGQSLTFNVPPQVGENLMASYQ